MKLTKELEAEILELRKAVSRQADELQYKNRELEIETALEKVRAIALGMKKPEDMLDVCTTISLQLQGLGLKEIRNIQTAIFYPAKGSYMNYEYYAKHKKTFITDTIYTDHKLARAFAAKMLKGKGEVSIIPIKGEKKVKEWLAYQKKTNVFIDKYLEKASSLTYYWHSLGPVALGISTYMPLQKDELGLFGRFLKVFELAYTRYLDIETAAAQAREAKIEAALEKVRSSSLAMHTSADLGNVVTIMLSNLQDLGFNNENGGAAHIIIFTKGSREFVQWSADPFLSSPVRTRIPYRDIPMQSGFFEAREKGLDFFAGVYSFEEKNEFFTHAFEHTDLKQLPDELKQMILESKTYSNWVAMEENSAVTVNSITGNQLSGSQIDILKRFARVFEQAYIRFLDLQKAEAQAKEARIEAALEKVRSRSLAMHRSEELQEVVTTVFERLKDLGIETDAINLDVFSENIKDAYLWTAVPGHSYSQAFHIPYNDTIVFRDIYEGMIAGKDLHSKVYTREEKDEFLTFVFEHTAFRHIPQERKAMLFATEASTVSVAYAKHIAIIAQRYRDKMFSEGENQILKRFAKVFEQSYTRFLDLKKAEAQAREAQIDASLERIRAKAMAMHRSEEIDEVLEVLFDQFDVLGIVPVSTHLTLIDIETNSFTFRETGKGGRKSFGEQKVPIDSMDIWKEAADKWKAMDPLSLNKLHFPKESLPMVWQVFHESFASMPEGHKITPEDYPDGIYHTAGNCKFGYIGMNQVRPATEEEEQIVLKFAVEFGRLYQRYLDLQKAEAQTKEARIEAAMERVRSASLAMHKSEELKNVVKVVFENFQSLGLKNIDSANINIIHPDSKEFDLWLAAPGQDYTRNFRLPYFDHPIANDFFKSVEKGETLHRRIYSYDTKNKYFGYMFEHSDNKYLPEERKKLILNGPGYAVSAAIARYSSIFIHSYSGIPFSDEDNSIVIRFSKVFDQSYTRFLDLQKVEAQAREARIEVSLERVRSKAMAMHSSQDLADTIAAFYNELESFSITPRRCGVGLINKDSRIVELSTMSSTLSGKSMEVIGRIKLKDHPVLEAVYDNWVLQKEYHPVLRGDDLVVYYKTILAQISYPDFPDDTVQYGYYFFFPEGGVYTWTEKEMTEEELTIYRRFTSVLSLTYKRYKDLQQAEDLAKQAAEDLVNLKIEKKRTEDALTELRNTQSQLVQSEKMASLGELTAGIAHEIQNPLNFVNNFSELSSELLDEMLDEVGKGNYDEAKAIVDDVKQNLEKINHHGKRADSIVKGMLQHSRRSSGEKELTDLNELADEYLRLAFHGLRAKDKSFNAGFKTEFDNSIDKIELIPQEIGRVLVNLLNNAFYAVNEKRRKLVNGYEPFVTVSTKKIGDKVELRVIDNGNGIPKEALEKIFQPFFTTKPAGQGTGLGLSLSYDIVRAHGGEINVETKPGEGTSFIVALPV